MTSSSDIMKEKSLHIAVLGHLSNNSYTITVVWYIKWKILIQRFQIFSNFWSITSSRDVIKQKLLNFNVLGDLSNKSYTNIVVGYIIWKVFTQTFHVLSNFWSMTSSRDVIKEKLLNIVVLGDWSGNSFKTTVVWYIKW